MKNHYTYVYRGLLAFIVILFVTQNLLSYLIRPFQYWDELYAAAFFPLLILWLIRKGGILEIQTSTCMLMGLLILFSICGFMGNIQNEYQPLSTAILDWFLHLKFFLAIGTTFILFEDVDPDELLPAFWPVFRILIIILFLTDAVDLVIHIFPASTRLGLRAEQLTYGGPANLALVCFLLIGLLFRMYEYQGRGIFPYFMMLAFVDLSTLRIKAIGGLLIAGFIYVVILRQRHHLGIMSWIIMGAGSIVLAWRQFSYYYSSVNTGEARAILQKIGFKIAQDYFPWGTGFGTFASAYSADPYSRVYFLYHLDRVWGLSRSYSAFISDTFWPMILGQSGWIGTVVYVLLIIVLAYKIFRLSSVNYCAYAAAFVLLLYLLISSTSESSFVNPLSVPMGMVLGLLFIELRKDSEL